MQPDDELEIQIGDNVIQSTQRPRFMDNKAQIVDAQVESKSTIVLSYGVETKKKASIILVGVERN